MAEVPQPLSYVTQKEFTELEQKFKQLQESFLELSNRYNEIKPQQKEVIYYLTAGYYIRFRDKDNNIELLQGLYSITTSHYFRLKEIKKIIYDFLLAEGYLANAKTIGLENITITSYSLLPETAYKTLNK